MIYLAGVITDKDSSVESANILRFYRKERELELLGVDVYNPVRYEDNNQTWSYYLAQDLEVIFSKKITGAYFMSGWEESEGAILEREACLRKQRKDINFLIIDEQ